MRPLQPSVVVHHKDEQRVTVVTEQTSLIAQHEALESQMLPLFHKVVLSSREFAGMMRLKALPTTTIDKRMQPLIG